MIAELKHYKEKKVRVGNIEINYAEAGKGKPMVFIHGWTNNWWGWIPLAEILKTKYRVILMDLPGYGESGQLKRYSLKIEAKYIKLFLEKLKIDKATIVGHSMGTYVVSRFLSLYPEKINKAILIGTVFRKGNKNMRLKITRKFFETVNGHNKIESLIKNIIDRKFYAYWVSKYVNMYKFDKNLVDKYGMVGRLKTSKEVYVDMGIEISGSDNDQYIAGSKVPILLIYGEKDKLCGLEQAKKCLKEKGDFQFVDIKEAGHTVTVEKPKEVAEAIEEFLGGILTV
jgi:pimeloyl-ACP methyl ester carboxylesterase